MLEFTLANNILVFNKANPHPIYYSNIYFTKYNPTQVSKSYNI